MKKVSFNYFYGGLKTGISEIYGETMRHFPSGLRKVYRFGMRIAV